MSLPRRQVLIGLAGAAAVGNPWSNAATAQEPPSATSPAAPFACDPRAFLDEHAPLWRLLGVHADALERVRAQVADFWRDGPDGWVPLWTAEAMAAEADWKWWRASALWGCAASPVVTTTMRRDAFRHQLDTYLRGSPAFGANLDRRALRIHDGTASVSIPVHLLERKKHAPLVLLIGDLDTNKMDLHLLGLWLCRLGGFRVAMVDAPGTFETDVPLRVDADQFYARVLEALDYGHPQGVFGLSFGGHWALQLALQKRVTAAVSLGGPVGSSTGLWSKTPTGFAGTLAQAMRWGDVPPEQDFVARTASFDLRSALESKDTAPLFVANGDADPFLPLEDTTLFSALPQATVHVVEGAGHAALDQFAKAFVPALRFLKRQLGE